MSVETRPAVELADAVEQLLTALVRSGRLLGDNAPSPLSTFQEVASPCSSTMARYGSVRWQMPSRPPTRQRPGRSTRS